VIEDIDPFTTPVSEDDALKRISFEGIGEFILLTSLTLTTGTDSFAYAETLAPGDNASELSPTPSVWIRKAAGFESIGKLIWSMYLLFALFTDLFRRSGRHRSVHFEDNSSL
jgi:hypothetical protein